MTIDSVPLLVGTLTQLRLLEPPQLAELAGDLRPRFSDPRSLAKTLLDRGWLTAYQLNQLFKGRGPDLTLTPYVILDRLGEGGAGEVFKARHTILQRVVALKVIRQELLADAEVVRRFYREVQVLSQLSHANIVHAYDAGPAGSTHFLVMEYLEGNDLARVVKQSGPLPVDRACNYTCQAALGLQHAYERGLVHRDIKPSNLFVLDGATPRPGRDETLPIARLTQLREKYPWGQVKVLDLGLARLRPSSDEAATAPLTEVGSATMGTIDYLAPEQALDFHGVDIRADVYSLGCTLFFLLTGQAPFPTGTMAQKLMRHQQVEPPPLEQFRPDVPKAVALAIRKMMAKRPEDRYQTPAEVAAVLAAPTTPVATILTGPGATRGVGKPVALLFAGAAVFLLLFLGAVVWALVPRSTVHKETATDKVVAVTPTMPAATVLPSPTTRPGPPPEIPRLLTLQGRDKTVDAILDPLEPDTEYKKDALSRRGQNSLWLIRFDLDRERLPRTVHVHKATLSFFVWDPHQSASTRVWIHPVKSAWKADATWNRPFAQSAWKGGGAFSRELDLGPAGPTLIVKPDPVEDTPVPPPQYDADVTEIVRAWVEKGEANHGLAVVPVADRAVDQGLQSRFQVRRPASSKSIYAPRLTVELQP